jgi:hypothetical protein
MTTYFSQIRGIKNIFWHIGKDGMEKRRLEVER